MRAIFLNSWFGQTGNLYFDFIKSESSKTDIFCLMEVTPELYSKLSLVLGKFNGIYKKGLNLKSLDLVCGQAIFVSGRMQIGNSQKVSIYKQSNRDVGFLEAAEINNGEKKIWVGNIHGKTLPGDKLDTPIRLKQSEKIINFFADKHGPKIIGGDFNLMPETNSVKMFEESGYRNLIKEFGIKNTRNRLSWEQFNNIQHFADYVFVSEEVRVKDFQVPNVEISDHEPLILDFEI